MSKGHVMLLRTALENSGWSPENAYWRRARWIAPQPHARQLQWRQRWAEFSISSGNPGFRAALAARRRAPGGILEYRNEHILFCRNESTLSRGNHVFEKGHDSRRLSTYFAGKRQFVVLSTACPHTEQDLGLARNKLGSAVIGIGYTRFCRQGG